MAGMSPNGPGPVPAELLNGSLSPRAIAAAPEPPVKSVQFVLTAPYRSRLPLRLEIRHTDTTDGITSTVRNFFGLYPGPDVTLGISFEDDDGSTFIARYDNVHEDKTVFVRVTQQPLGLAFHAATSPAPVYHNANANGYLPGGPQPPHAHASRPTSGASRLRSPSPNGGRGRRSTSTGTNPTAGKKGRSRSSKNRSQVNGDAPGDSFNGYSSGDGAAGSSFRSKEQLGNTDISVENIVEGGRRKRAKFESAVSCELPSGITWRTVADPRPCRSCLSLPLPKCRPRPRIPLSPPRAGSTPTKARCRSSSPARTHSATRNPSHPRGRT